MSKWIRFTELGPERCCSRCGDWWPDDAEFFYQSRDKSRQPCKACYEQLPSVVAKKQRRAAAQGARP